MQPGVNTHVYAKCTGNYFMTAGASLFLQGERLALSDLYAGAAMTE